MIIWIATSLGVPVARSCERGARTGASAAKSPRQMCERGIIERILANGNGKNTRDRHESVVIFWTIGRYFKKALFRSITIIIAVFSSATIRHGIEMDSHLILFR